MFSPTGVRISWMKHSSTITLRREYSVSLCILYPHFLFCKRCSAWRKSRGSLQSTGWEGSHPASVATPSALKQGQDRTHEQAELQSLQVRPPVPLSSSLCTASTHSVREKPLLDLKAAAMPEDEARVPAKRESLTRSEAMAGPHSVLERHQACGMISLEFELKGI